MITEKKLPRNEMWNRANEDKINKNYKRNERVLNDFRFEFDEADAKERTRKNGEHKNGVIHSTDQ